MGFDKGMMSYIHHYSVIQNSSLAFKHPLCSMYSSLTTLPHQPQIYSLCLELCLFQDVKYLEDYSM